MNLDRARGALLGLAVGDALGTTHEFQALDAPAFPQLATGPLCEVVGGGPFALEAGQVTDDTHMACCLADSLRERGGFEAADVAARYRRWMDHAFDIGNQTAAALGELDLLPPGTSPTEAGRLVWERGGLQAAGNGSLMRTAPIAVALAADPIARRAAATGDSAITHFDPRCQLACAALDAAIAEMVLDTPAAMRPRTVLEIVLAEILAAAGELMVRHPGYEDEIAAARVALQEDVGLARARDPELYGAVHLHATQGFVRVAFRLALWELLHAPSYEHALLDVVNRGGDADTNGAITGALLGAFHGAASIPEPWSGRVLGALAGRTGPLADAYHPRRLLMLLDEPLTCPGG